MATTEITKDNLDQIIGASGVVLIDFWAEWCGPCRMFGPIFEASSEKHPAVTFGKVDTEAQRELAAGFQITSIPTLMAFRDGILVFSQPGALPAAGLAQVVDAVLGLDMAAVRAQLAAATEDSSL